MVSESESDSDDSIDMPTAPSRVDAPDMARYGVGADIMAKMGYKSGHGLGADAHGRVEPVMHSGDTGKSGLGAKDRQSSETPKPPTPARFEKSSSESAACPPSLQTINDRRIQLLQEKRASNQEALDKVQTQISTIEEILKLSNDEIDLDGLYAEYARVWSELHLDEMTVAVLALSLQELDFDDEAFFGLLARTQFMHSDESMALLLHQRWLPKLEAFISTGWNDHVSLRILQLVTEHSDITCFVKPSIAKLVGPHLIQDGGSPDLIIEWLAYLPDSLDQILDAKSHIMELTRGEGIANPMLLRQVKVWVSFANCQRDLGERVTTYIESLRTISTPSKTGLTQDVLDLWYSMCGDIYFAQVLRDTFFQKWSEFLYQMLTSTQIMPVDVLEWFQEWCTVFAANPRVAEMFEPLEFGALNLINEALDLGTHRDKLRLPSMAAKLRVTALTSTFRDVVQHFCETHDLYFTQPMASSSTDHVGYKISRSPDSHETLSCFIDDDVLWVHSGANSRPVSLEEVLSLI